MNAKRLVPVLAVVVIGVSLLLCGVSCEKLSAPTVEGEAFLVMKSLDVKKLGDLHVYLLTDPYPAIEGLKRDLEKAYSELASNDGVDNPRVRVQVLEKKVQSLKTQAARLAAEHAKESSVVLTNELKTNGKTVTLEDEIQKLERELQFRRAQHKLWHLIDDPVARRGEKKLSEILMSKVTTNTNTDSEGRFVIQGQSAGSYVVSAETEMPGDQRVLWFEKVTIPKHGKVQIKLSNSNAFTNANLADVLLGDVTKLQSSAP